MVCSHLALIFRLSRIIFRFLRIRKARVYGLNHSASFYSELVDGLLGSDQCLTAIVLYKCIIVDHIDLVYSLQ